MKQKYKNLQFMSNSELGDNAAFDMDQLDNIANAMAVLAKSFDLSYQEVVESMSKYLTEYEFEWICEELEDRSE